MTDDPDIPLPDWDDLPDKHQTRVQELVGSGYAESGRDAVLMGLDAVYLHWDGIVKTQSAARQQASEDAGSREATNSEPSDGA